MGLVVFQAVCLKSADFRSAVQSYTNKKPISCNFQKKVLFLQRDFNNIRCYEI